MDTALKVDFLRGVYSDCLTGLFNESRLLVMLAVSDFDAMDIDVSFLDTLFEAFCGLSRTAEGASATTEHGDMVNFAYKHHMNFGWAETTIQILVHYIQLLKKLQNLRLESIKLGSSSRRHGMRKITYVRQFWRLEVDKVFTATSNRHPATSSDNSLAGALC